MASESDGEQVGAPTSELGGNYQNAIEQGAREMSSADLEPMSAFDDQLGSHASEQPVAAHELSSDANAILMDLPVIMKVVLGSSRMALASVAKLSKGSVIKLEKRVGEPVDILVNGRLIAQGEVVVLDQEGNRFGVVLTQVGGPAAPGKKAF